VGAVNLSDVAEEVASMLGSIEGLRAFAYPPGAINPPTAVVLNPNPGDIVYDDTYGRGGDRMTLPLMVLIGQAEDRSAMEGIRPYLDGSGPKSVKQALEAGTPKSFDTIRVQDGGVDGVTWGGVEYVAALFNLDILGPGS
jgi:hypothetical protein